MKTDTETKQITHTPGPWTADDQGMIRSTTGCIVCQAYDNPDDGTEPIDQEPSAFNARLIAAAPDLLTALKGDPADHCGDTQLYRIGWLETLLQGIRDEPEAFKILAGDDPQALGECMNYCQHLVEAARAAIAKVEAS